MFLNTFFRCYCGKVHTYGGLSSSTRCSCGRYLMDIAMSGGR